MEEAGKTAVEAKLRQLGYGPDARLLIIHGDDLGMSHANNAATFEAMEEGVATSASLLVPCPWAYAAARYASSHPDLDVGVEVALTSEWDAYRWRPVLGAERCPSLVDDAGFLHSRTEGLWRHANRDEVQREAEAQIQQALAWGVRPTHLAWHMGSFREYRDLALQLGRSYDLPVRTVARVPRPGGLALGEAHSPYRSNGILTPDYWLGLPLGNFVDGRWVPVPMGPGAFVAYESDVVRRLGNLAPGVTEMIFHAALPTPEVEAMTPDWRVQVANFELVRHSARVRSALDESAVNLIGWRELREAQRSMRRGTR